LGFRIIIITLALAASAPADKVLTEQDLLTIALHDGSIKDVLGSKNLLR